MKFSVIDYTVKRGRVLFTLKQSRFFGLFSKKLQVITEQAEYANYNCTAIMSWPACEVYTFSHPVTKFVNAELRRMIVEGELHGHDCIYRIPDHAQEGTQPPNH